MTDVSTSLPAAVKKAVIIDYIPISNESPLVARKEFLDVDMQNDEVLQVQDADDDVE